MYRYVHARGETYGPVDDERLLVWLRERRIGADDLVWLEEENRWVPLRDVGEFGKAIEDGEAGAAAAAGLAQVSSVAPSVAPTGGAVPENLFAFEGARRFVRFRTHLQGRYALLHGNRPPAAADYKRATVTNLSAGGAGFEAVRTVPVGTVVHLEFKIPDGNPDPFVVHAEVVRTAPSVQPGMTEHGVRFAALPADLKRRLVDFLENIISRGGETGESPA